MAELEVRVDHQDGGAVVALVGELDVAGLPALAEGFGALASRYDADQVAIDCSRLVFLDAAGLGGLIRHARRLGGRPVLRDVAGPVLLVLRHTTSGFPFEPANA